jgi:glutathione S-transferase
MTTIIDSLANSGVETAPVLELSRRFAAPPERVFDAWLWPRWGEWLGPAGVRCEAASGDARVGGAFKMTMIQADGRITDISGVYLEMKRPTTLAFTWLGCSGESLIRLDFRRDGDGTLMTMRQTGFAAESRDGFVAGWAGEGASFDRLAALLAQAAR